jgi:uncharacterized protein (DUF58 family)
MRNLPNRLRHAATTRVRGWIRRRQGADAGPVVLRRGRIYILPTPLGLAYAAMVFAMLLGGLNYNNNLGLAFAFLLTGVGLVAMHHCHGTLEGLALSLHSTESAFVGRQVTFSILLANPSVAARPRIEVSADDALPGLADLPPGTSAATELRVAARHRGPVPLPRYEVSTRHPLGLFRAWSVVHPDYRAIAWPRPAERGRPPPRVETDTGGAQDRARGDADFVGLKSFQLGDPLHRIAWKSYARGHGLHVKQFAGTDVTSYIFEWDSLTGLDAESRLSLICRWVIDAHERGEAYGIRLPGSTIEPNVGRAHREHCLTALALYDGTAGHG